MPLQREYANRVFTSECKHQLNTMTQCVSFFEDYIAWTSQNANKAGSRSTDIDSDGPYYTTEASLVVEEAREALRILKLLCRDSRAT